MGCRHSVAQNGTNVALVHYADEAAGARRGTSSVRNLITALDPATHFLFVARKIRLKDPAHPVFLGHDKVPLDPPDKDRDQREGQHRIKAQDQARKDQRIGQINRIARAREDAGGDQAGGVLMRDNGRPGAPKLQCCQGDKHYPAPNQQPRQALRDGVIKAETKGQETALDPGHNDDQDQPDRRNVEHAVRHYVIAMAVW